MSENAAADVSISSSIARHAGITNVGDTKSIVLALQALQEKIRKLELDRNFHQEQCEAARAAHDAYKREVEAQLEGERRQHRQREHELQEMIARANAERSRLQGTLEESKHDISSFRAELETLLEKERGAAKEREDRLRDQIEQGRSELLQERRALEQLHATIEQVRTEKEIVLSTNRRLEGTIKDLIAMNNGLMDRARAGGGGGGTAQHHHHNLAAAATAPRHRDPHTAGAANLSRDSVSSRASARGRRDNSVVRSSHDRRPHHHNQQQQQRTASLSSSSRGQRARYTSPTHSSELKCARCIDHRVVERGSAVAAAPPPPPVRRAASATGKAKAVAALAATMQGSGETGTGAGAHKPQEQADALDEVYEGLVEEHRALNNKYREIIERANAPGAHVTPEVLTATLNSVMAQIDRKAEQLRLLRATRAELDGDGDGDGGAQRSSAGGGGHGARRGGRARSPQPRGTDKAVRKGALVNELRALFERATAPGQ